MKNYRIRNVHVYFGKNANAERNLRKNINEIKRVIAIYFNKNKLVKNSPTNGNNYINKVDEAIKIIKELHKRLHVLHTKYQIYHVNNSLIKANINLAAKNLSEYTKFRSSLIKTNKSNANHVANLRKQINNIKQGYFNSPNLAHLPINFRRRYINLHIRNEPRVKKLQNEINIYTTHVAPTHKPVFKS
jgi:hypothetical protein